MRHEDATTTPQIAHWAAADGVYLVGDVMTMREEFEAHMRRLNCCVRLARKSKAEFAEYRTVSVEKAWDLWQAAWRTSRFAVAFPSPEQRRAE